jgi:hypothetical protein
MPKRIAPYVFEGTTQRNFANWRWHAGKSATALAKVFWFFSSEKNCFFLA